MHRNISIAFFLSEDIKGIKHVQYMHVLQLSVCDCVDQTVTTLLYTTERKGVFTCT